MTLLPPPEAVAWVRRNLPLLGGLGSVGAMACSAWLALWLSVYDHGKALAAIQDQQTAQAKALADARDLARADLREMAEAQRRWQDKAEARDEAQALQLGTIARDVARLTGLVQRAEATRGWRVERRPDPQATEGAN